MIALVEAAEIDPPPLRLDESEPVPFESTPIKSANSIKYNIVDAFCAQKRCQLTVRALATSRTTFKWSTSLRRL